MTRLDIYGVAEVTERLKVLIETDPVFQDLWVQGEVSNFTVSTAGHAYFTLKDATSALRCVMFRGQIQRRSLLPKSGDAIVAHGHLSVYEPQGQYQLYVDLVMPQGLGALHLQFEALRARLEQEGLFDAARKRPIPRFPKAIGVVTSPTGAAIHDILTVIERRYPSVEVIVAPTLVQGEEAPPQICAAIAALNEWVEVDTILVARGGGSIEDLWPFNDESVARAIYASRRPVICGIGHETDVTIADLVADLRAPTPSVAAELAVPDAREWRETIAGQQQRLAASIGVHLDTARATVRELTHRLQRGSPQATIDRWRMEIDELSQRSEQALTHLLALRRERVTARELQLAALDPRGVLARGYAICRHLPTGRVIRSVGQVAPGDPIEVQVADGAIPGEVQRQRRWW